MMLSWVPSRVQLRMLHGQRFELNQSGQSGQEQLPQEQPPAPRCTYLVAKITVMLVTVGLLMLFGLAGESYPSFDDRVPPKALPFFESLPKKAWMYRSTLSNEPKLPEVRSVSSRILKESGFEVTMIDETNYRDFLNDSTASSLSECLEEFRQFARPQIESQESSQRRMRVMETRIQALHVLEANGGVMIDENLTLIEDLSWVDSIDSNPYVNRLNHLWPTEVIGFLDGRTSSDRIKFSTNEPMNTPFKHIREKPSLSSSLIIARKNAYFISKLCVLFRAALHYGTGLLQQITVPQYPQSNNEYQFLMLSRELMEGMHRFKASGKTTLLVDTLGLSLINNNYATTKLITQISNYHENTNFHFYADITYQQLQQFFGSFHYALYLLQEEEFENVQEGRHKVMEQSLLHHLLPNLTSDRLYPDPEVSTTNLSAPVWESLPKIVWTIWITGYESSYTMCKLAFAIIKQRFQSKGYTVNLVTMDNMREFLDDKTVDELLRITNNNKFRRFVTTLPDLLRLALLDRHGGIYMDMSTLLLADADWIRNIAQWPSHMLINRFSELPKVLYVQSHFMPHPPFWTINPETHTKQQDQASIYENSFIVAEKGSEYIKEVLSVYKKLLETPTDQVHKYIHSYGLEGNQIVIDEDLYVLQMEIMTTVLLQKQKQLDSRNDTQWINAAHYYGAWSIYCPSGHCKFRKMYNHLDDLGSQPSSYLYDYSEDYVFGLIGRPRIPLVKLIGEEVRAFVQLFESFSPANDVISDEFHPRSFLKQLIDEFKLQIVRGEDKVQVVRISVEHPQSIDL